MHPRSAGPGVLREGCRREGGCIGLGGLSALIVGSMPCRLRDCLFMATGAKGYDIWEAFAMRVH